MPARISICLALAACLLLAPFLAAQEEQEERGGRDRPSRGERKQEKIKPYEKVITKKARSDAGLFLVHRVEDKLYYEIKPDLFGKEMLWVTQIAQTQAGHGYGGTPVGNRVVRWVLKDESVLLRDVKYTIRANVEDSVTTAVRATSLEPIIKTFPVKAWGVDKSAVIDVTSLFTSDVQEFSPKRRLGASSLDSKRTFLEKVRSFPSNIETKVLATYKLRDAASSRGGSTPRPRRRRSPSRDRTQSGISVMLHHSMVSLPEIPMQPRVHDARVGFFNVRFQDYGQQEHQVKEVRYITRWRLEKKDPEAAVSDPVKPIVFYVGRGVPAKWRPWVKRGIEMWQPAFEAAGFSNAILARDPPSAQENPDWDAEDARYSTIRWLPATIENAMGPHVHDPRTGEILEADILVYHNILKLVRDWYFVQASPCDERAQVLPMPDDLIGELLAYVIAHEVGHSIGFPHNMKASSAFTIEQLRDPAFTHKYGTEASIMDYGRFNYVAQPGDGAALIPKIGPYDFFAVEWGYSQFPEAGNPENEKNRLDALCATQVENPVLLFGGPNSRQDPTQQTEDLGNDAIRATELGLQNLRRVASYLVKATCKPGKDYSLLQNMYEELLSQRNRELGHVANLIAGARETNLWYGDAEKRFHKTSPARQREAVAFLLEHGFKTPTEFLDPDILDRLEASGAAERILSANRRLLSSLINESRIDRMAEQVVGATKDVYKPVDLLADLRNGIWSELASRSDIDLYRRQLQRLHVKILGDAVSKKDSSSDLSALSRGELTILLQTVGRVIPSYEDTTTRFHLEDLRARIQKLLDPKSKARQEGDA